MACRWLSSGKSQHLVADKAYPPHFVQQEERVTTHIRHVLATGRYQAVSATGEQWLNLYCSDGWDRVIIMMFSYYRLCYIVIIYIVVSHILFYNTFSLFVCFFSCLTVSRNVSSLYLSHRNPCLQGWKIRTVAGKWTNSHVSRDVCLVLMPQSSGSCLHLEWGDFVLNYPRRFTARKTCLIKTRILGYCSEYLKKQKNNNNWVFQLLTCLFELLARQTTSITLTISFSKLEAFLCHCASWWLST